MKNDGKRRIGEAFMGAIFSCEPARGYETAIKIRAETWRSNGVTRSGDRRRTSAQ